VSRLRTPLLSLGADGQLGQSVAVRKHKGQHIAQAYAIPTNPRTPDQVAQRTTWQQANDAWRLYQFSQDQWDAWKRSASVDPRTVTYFNEALSHLSRAFQLYPNPSFISEVSAGTSLNAQITLVNQLDGSTGSEAGPFEVWAGPTIRGMTLKGTASITGGVITTPVLSDEAGIVYLRLIKDGLDRGGIWPVQLVGLPPPGYPVEIYSDDNPSMAAVYQLLLYWTGSIIFKHPTATWYLRYSLNRNAAVITDAQNDALSTKWWVNLANAPYFNGTYLPEAPETGVLTVNAPKDAIVGSNHGYLPEGDYMIETGHPGPDPYKREDGAYYLYRATIPDAWVINDAYDPAPSAPSWTEWSGGSSQGLYFPDAPAVGNVYVAQFKNNNLT